MVRRSRRRRSPGQRLIEGRGLLQSGKIDAEGRPARGLGPSADGSGRMRHRQGSQPPAPQASRLQERHGISPPAPLPRRSALRTRGPARRDGGVRADDARGTDAARRATRGHQGQGRLRLGPAVALIAVAAVWWVVVLVAQQVAASPTVRLLALFVHLTSLVVGFGAVLSIDAYALLWLLGRRPVDEVARAASSVDLLVWLGLTGLVLSGMFLGPDTANPFTQTKLLLVLALGLNGVNLHALSRRTAALAATTAFRAAPRSYLLWAGTSTAISQVGWWGAVVIGFLNSSGRL